MRFQSRIRYVMPSFQRRPSRNNARPIVMVLGSMLDGAVASAESLVGVEEAEMLLLLLLEELKPSWCR